jgi:hypothetical protein
MVFVAMQVQFLSASKYEDSVKYDYMTTEPASPADIQWLMEKYNLKEKRVINIEQAVAVCDEVEVQLYLRRNGNLGLSSHVLYTAFGAVLGNKRKTVELLLKAGFLINDQYDNQTVLHQTVLRCDYPGVELALEKGACVDAKDSRGMTALMCALSCNFNYYDPYAVRPIVLLLLACDSDLKAKDNEGKTILHSLVNANNLGLVPLAYEIGVDFEAVDLQGQKACQCTKDQLMQRALSENYAHVKQINVAELKIRFAGLLEKRKKGSQENEMGLANQQNNCQSQNLSGGDTWFGSCTIS